MENDTINIDVSFDNIACCTSDFSNDRSIFA